MAGLLDRRFVVVAGKGGVGRTTVSAALALAAARQGKRVLVIECNARDRVPALFGADPAGYEPHEVDPGVWTLNITPEAALREYGVMKLRFQRLYSIVFENDLMRRLLRMIPGMNDLLIIGKSSFMEAARDRKTGRPVWDIVILDGPPTGQGVALFRLPRTILEAVRSGPLADEAARIHALLTDVARTRFVVLTAPEEMAVNEAIELGDDLRDLVGGPAGVACVNGVWPEVLSDHELDILMTFVDARRGEDAAVDGLVCCVLESRARRLHQEPNIRRFERHVGLPMLRLPHVFTRRFDRAAVAYLSQILQAELGRHETSH